MQEKKSILNKVLKFSKSISFYTFNLTDLKYSLLLVGLVCISFACNTNKRLNQVHALSIQEQIETSSVFQKGFTGVQIFDLTTKQNIYKNNEKKYFTAASNTKILTFHICNKILSDSIPALQYIIRGDSLIFWGTGDPSFLHPDLTIDSSTYHFLKKRKEQLFFSSHNFQDESFGPGWAWDDYSYSFQTEKSPFPIYGNLVHFKKSKNKSAYSITPSFFKKYFHHNEQLKTNSAKVIRQRTDNLFEFNKSTAVGNAYSRYLPFKYSDTLFTQILSELIQKEVKAYPFKIKVTTNKQKRYGVRTKLLYQQMMQESDNFIAEQLLLVAANELCDTLSFKKVIRFAKENLFPLLPDSPIMRDGSGLSRYNLMTPRSIVNVLQQLHQDIPEEELFPLFSVAGQNGSLKNWYKKGEPIFLYGKTGSMSNIFCLSGYLVTKKGKKLAFSFMHNNFPGSSNAHRKEMAKILKNIYLKY